MGWFWARLVIGVGADYGVDGFKGLDGFGGRDGLAGFGLPEVWRGGDGFGGELGWEPGGAGLRVPGCGAERASGDGGADSQAV